MVLKLYAAEGARGGAAVVALILLEKQIPFEHIVVDLQAKEQKTPEHLARHPFGQVPVIDDDGFILYETRAICRYLAEKYAAQGRSLIPTGGVQERALFEQAASVEFANFYQGVVKIRAEVLFKPRSGLPIDQVVLDTALADFATKLDVYEKILLKQKFIAGNELTVVDLFHLIATPNVAAAREDIMENESRPNVARWWNALVLLPAWVKLRAEGIQSTA